MTKIISLLLAFVMLLGLAGCAGNADINSAAPAVSAQPQAAEGVSEPQNGLIDVCMQAEEIDIPTELKNLDYMTISNGRYFVAGSNISGLKLFVLDNDGKYKELKLELENSNYMFSGLCEAEDKVFALISDRSENGLLYLLYTYDAKSLELISVCQFDADKTEMVRTWFAVGDKIAALSFDGKMVFFSQSGEFIKEITADFRFAAVCDGKLYAGGKLWKSEFSLLEIDPVSFEIKELCPLEDQIYCSSASKNGLVLSDGAKVYTLDTETGSINYLFDWNDTGALLMSVPDSFIVDENGDYYIADSFVCCLYRISKGETLTKRELTIGVAEGSGATYLNTAISKFNMSSRDYVVHVKKYSSDKVDTVLTELIAGDAPDILFLGSAYDRENMFRDVHVNDSICVDLLPYFENDPDISLDVLLPGVAESIRQDGHLYKLSPCVNAVGLIIPASVANELDTWTVDDICALNDSLPEDCALLSHWSRESFLESLCTLASAAYIDYSKGVCSFDGGDFAKWLELGKNMVYMQELGSFNSRIIDGAIHFGSGNYARSSFGEDYVIAGYPEVGTFLESCVGDYMIMQSSENKDGAWEFLKVLLSPKVQQVLTAFGTPVTVEGLEAQVQSYIEGDCGDVSAEDLEDIELIRNAIMNADRFAQSGSVSEIIKEEAARYFDGAITLEQAVSAIQSKAAILLGEQQ